MARKILLADDSVTAQNMGRKILADAGYDVITVNNGSAALKRITESKPDLIVLDVYMPGYSGLEVCQRLKDAGETAHIPVLLTVGKLEPFKVEEARRVRADAHIIKPFEASELLTAITRLEDRMVPQSASGEGPNSDTGWKSRLRFPAKKKREEIDAQPDDTAGAGGFRDFRKVKGKTDGAGAPLVKAVAQPAPEPGEVPDIPRDITPEELDALSAVAEKLDGPVGTVETVSAQVPLEPEAVISLGSAGVEARPSQVDAGAAREQREAENEPATATAEVVSGREDKTVQIPVEQVEPSPENEAAVEEWKPVATGLVHAGSLVEEPAPVDRNDEPGFEIASSTAAEAKAEMVFPAIHDAATEASSETKRVEVIPAAAAAAIIAQAPESKSEEIARVESAAIVTEVVSSETKNSEMSNHEHATGTASAAEISPAAVVEAEGAAPSDEELAEALRLLTPATGNMEGVSVPLQGTLAAAGQLLAEEAARNGAAGPRWRAEAVALTSDDMATSLEAEMFRTFSATFSGGLFSGTNEPVGMTGVSAIAAAVESRLAAAAMADGARLRSETRPESIGSAQKEDQGSPGEATPVLSAAVPADTAAMEERKGDSGSADAGGSATFAEAVSQDHGDGFLGSATSEATRDEAASTENGDPESMRKEKAKAEKSNWNQFHNAASTSAVAVDAVEAAKQTDYTAEESGKTMAAAASADGTPAASAASAAEANTIANIVDSVMANLRPQIVEEIAKKLAGK